MNKKMTIAECNALEKDKRAALNELNQRLARLENERGELLIQFATGDESARKKIADIQKERGNLVVEIEAVEALLSGIPKQRALAQAEEVEAELKAVDLLQARIVELTAKVDSEAESFARVVSDFYKAVSELSPLTSKFHNPLSYYDFGILDSLGVALRKHDLFKFIKVGKFRGALPASETIKRTLLRDIERLISNKGELAKVLRGEMKADPNRCPECYAALKTPYMETGKHYCEKCGYESGT